MTEIIVGIDEAGRGPLAGPVVAGAVVFPAEMNLDAKIFKDSKKLSNRKIAYIYAEMVNEVDWGVGIVSAAEIDKIGIKKATEKAMNLALKNLAANPTKALVDGRDKFKFPIESEDIIKGDEKVAQISAASIVAKYTRDQIMHMHADKWPEFNFQENMGYGSAEHRKLLEQGIYCDIHRKSYNPLKKFLNQSSFDF